MIETKFKNTEIGPIPVDWEVAPLNQFFEFGNGYTPSTENPKFWANKGLPWFKMEDIRKNGRILKDSILHITPAAVKGRGLFPAGSFILSTTATIGEHAWLIADSLANQQFTFLTKGKSLRNIDSQYFFYKLYEIGEWCRKNVSKSTLMAVDMPGLKAYPLSIPPLAEQEAIGEALREVDELIEGLKKLVAKKRAIKQGAMFQLLSGKSRLPGFSEPWKEATLANLADINPSCDLPDYFEYVDLDSVNQGVLLYHRTENRQTAPSRAQRLAQFGDIFFQTVRPYQKNNFYFDKDIKTSFVFSTGYAQLRPYINGVFLYHALQSNEFVNLVLLNCIGTSYPSINATTLGELIISIPTSLAEQEVIAKVLTDMDAEIEALSRKVAKYEQVKQGMMQQLLTGKIRLV